jgi:hypothetical protein
VTRDKIDMEAAKYNLGGAPLVGVPATDLRYVRMDFRSGQPTTHIVLADELDVFIEACKRLHYSPGANPASGKETSRIWRLSVAHLMACGPYWWSTPNLGDNGQADGALIINEGIYRTIWRDETYEALS